MTWPKMPPHPAEVPFPPSSSTYLVRIGGGEARPATQKCKACGWRKGRDLNGKTYFPPPPPFLFRPLPTSISVHIPTRETAGQREIRGSEEEEKVGGQEAFNFPFPGGGCLEEEEQDNAEEEEQEEKN